MLVSYATKFTYDDETTTFSNKQNLKNNILVYRIIFNN